MESTGMSNTETLLHVRESWWIMVRRAWSMLDGMHRSKASYGEFMDMLEDQTDQPNMPCKRTALQIADNEPRHPMHNSWGVWQVMRVIDYDRLSARTSVALVANALNATNEEYVARTNLDWYIFIRLQVQAYLVVKEHELAEANAKEEQLKKTLGDKYKGKGIKTLPKIPSPTHIAAWVIEQHSALNITVRNIIPCLVAGTYVVCLAH
jgi:hypothetical protein